MSADLLLRPSWRFVLSRPAHFVAFGFGAGLVPFAPGTLGTLVAIPIHFLLAPRLAPTEYLMMLAVLFVLGTWACEVTGQALGAADHGGMVWDEVVAFLLVLYIVPGTVSWQAAAFLLFRAFDILKPPPIRYYERTFRSGLGVMLDDVVAAFYTLVALAVGKTVWDIVM